MLVVGGMVDLIVVSNNTCCCARLLFLRVSVVTVYVLMCVLQLFEPVPKQYSQMLVSRLCFAQESDSVY